jgi:hypothetical protein
MTLDIDARLETPQYYFIINMSSYMSNDCLFHVVSFLEDKYLLQSAALINTNWHFAVTRLLRIRLSTVHQNKIMPTLHHSDISSYSLYMRLIHSRVDNEINVDDVFYPFDDDIAIIVMASRCQGYEKMTLNYNHLSIGVFEYTAAEKVSSVGIQCVPESSWYPYVRVRVVLFNQKEDHMIKVMADCIQFQCSSQSVTLQQTLSQEVLLQMKLKYSVLESSSCDATPGRRIDIDWNLSRINTRNETNIFIPHASSSLGSFYMVRLFAETIWDIVSWHYSYWWFYNVDVESYSDTIENIV